MRVLITGGAEALGRAFSEVLGAQGQQLVLTGRPGATPKLTENLAAELKRRPIAVPSYDPRMVDVGLMNRRCDDDSDGPHRQRGRMGLVPARAGQVHPGGAVGGSFGPNRERRVRSSTGELITPEDG